MAVPKTREEYESRDGNIIFWDKEGVSWIAGSERWPLPATKLREVFSSLEPFSSVIDFGCNFARARSLFPGKKYIGVDISGVALAEAFKRNPDDEFLQVDFDSDTWNDLPEVDIVFCNTVLVHIVPEHFERVIEKLLSCCKVLVCRETDIEKHGENATFSPDSYNRDYRQIFNPRETIALDDGSRTAIYIVEGYRYAE